MALNKKGVTDMATSVSGVLGPRNQEFKNLVPMRKQLGLGDNTHTGRSKETEVTADYLVEKLQSPEHRPFFLKAAWRLPRGTIDRLVAASLELGRKSAGLFYFARQGRDG